MGLFDRFRKKSSGAVPEAQAEPEGAQAAAEETPPPDVIALARRGMSAPPEDYIDAVLRAQFPEAAGAQTVKVGLAQPRWPPSPDLMDSAVAAIVRAMASEHGIDAGKSNYVESQGPDGAEVVVVSMWR